MLVHVQSTTYMEHRKIVFEKLALGGRLHLGVEKLVPDAWQLVVRNLVFDTQWPSVGKLESGAQCTSAQRLGVKILALSARRCLSNGKLVHNASVPLRWVLCPCTVLSSWVALSPCLKTRQLEKLYVCIALSWQQGCGYKNSILCVQCEHWL